MKRPIRTFLLWIWPRLRRLYADYGMDLSLRDMLVAPGAGTAGTTRGKDHQGFAGVPGAHLWLLAFLLIAAGAHAQQGGQTSSVPPLTGSAAPTGNCGVGSMFVNTTTGDLYDCNAGSWLKVNGGGSGAFSGGLGTSFQDATEIAAPANPAAGNDRLWLDSTTHLLACHTSGGASCMPSGGAGTVTQVTSGNFSPLFNVSVATNTTTPAFSFAGISQTQNLFFASPNGASGNPSFRAMVAADVPASANSCAAHQFTISLASGLTVTCAQPVAADIGSLPGSSGQLLFNNAGAIGAEDPVVSYNNPSETTAAWTSATANNTVLSVTLPAGTGVLSTVMVTLNQGSTITGGAVAFLASDTTGLTNTYPVYCIPQGAGTGPVSSYTLTASTNIAFQCSLSSFEAFEVKLSPAISGTGTVNVGIQPSAAPSQAQVAVVNFPATQAVSGTITANAGTGQFNVTCTAANCPVNVAQIGGTNIVADPCQANTKSYVSISQTANAQLVTGTTSKKIYPCSIHVVTATAQNVALVEGTGSTCGTGTAGVTGFGGATAATGWNFAANGGIAYGAGSAALGAEGTAADNLCLFQSGTGQVSGGLSYVVQ